MSFEQIVEHYGYAAILVGTFLEGETILIIGGYLAHRGYLSLPGVMAAAFAGSLCIDQTLFFLTRLRGREVIRRFQKSRDRIDRVNLLVERHPRKLLVGFRFLYGIRTVTPLALGLTSVRAGRFIQYNAIGALLWAVSISSAGYLFGRSIEAVFRSARRYEILVIASIAAASASVFIIRRLRKKKTKSATPLP